MIAHRVSKRSAKGLPQVESTVSLSITAKLMKFVARQDFIVGNCHVKKGETCFAVRSERREGRYYIVRFNSEHNTYQCSCGADCCEQEPFDGSRPLTAAEWKKIARADRKRQQAWQDEYRQKAEALGGMEVVG